MKFTLLADLQDVPGFHSEFGLSLLLENGSDPWLFDTGSGGAFLQNCKILNIPENRLRQVIISHGHYDHTGGLSLLQPQIIYGVKGIDQSHYSRHADGEIHEISMPPDSRRVLKNSPVKWISGFTGIAPGVFLSGAIPRDSGEDCGGDFYHDEQCENIDIVPEEQFLLTADGILVTGCCHAGIINSLEFCRHQHPEISIRAIVGGLHLRRASRQRLQDTAEYLQKSGIKKLFIGHCTGENAVQYLAAALPGCQVISPELGTTWEV